MQVSKQQLNDKLEKQIYEVLNQMVTDITHPEEAQTILQDLLTPTEYQVIAKRIAIALFLDKGRSYENIKTNLKVSSATIASMAETMDKPGIKLLLQKVKTEEWAEEWTRKIGSVFNKFLPQK